LKGVNLLGLGFFENRELKIKLGGLVEKHNQSRKKPNEEERFEGEVFIVVLVVDLKRKCLLPTVVIWCSIVRGKATTVRRKVTTMTG